MQTDVLAIGLPFAGGDSGASIQTLAQRIRPAKGGYSVGHIAITAGTIGTCAYDILPGGTVSPPTHGVGIPSKFYILSNNHVGRITTINATVDVGYGGGRVGRFHDQIITTAISAGGDSGSLVTTLENVVVGLLFAGSSISTIANQFENVRALLRVEVAEQIL